MRTCLGLALVMFVMGNVRAEVEAELTQEAFLREVFLHAYHWYLDDRFFGEQAQRESVDFWIRELKPELDEDDRSKFAEVFLPAADLLLRLKKSDYEIPEIDLQVKDSTYRIVGAELRAEQFPQSSEAVAVVLDRSELWAWMETRREKRHQLSLEKLTRIEEAVKQWLRDHVDSPPEVGHRFYVADVTPVSGDVWVYWPHGRLVLRLAGEMGHGAHALTHHLPLHVEVHHLQRGVVASLLEQSGGNRALTKDWAGRILYECLVRGVAVDWDW